MVELKLIVALDEGTAGRAGHCTVQEGLRIEALMPGLHVLCVPTPKLPVHFVILTDDSDLNLLGFKMGEQHAAVLLHDRDIEALHRAGIELDMRGFNTLSALPGWHFRAFPWGNRSAIEAAVAELVRIG